MKLLVSLALVVGLTFATAPASAEPAGPADPGSNAPTLPPPAQEQAADQALAALDRVQDLLAGGPATTSGGPADDLTLALRDLALVKEALPEEEQAEAERYFGRPTVPSSPDCEFITCYTAKAKRTCSQVICVHWVRKSRDPHNGVRAADRDDDGVPNYVERVRREMTKVHRTYVSSGYRAPLPDGGRGGNKRPDVYLAQLGDRGLYGYCTTDDPNPPASGGTWGYCVLDNDYSRREFPAHTPTQNMRVTAAHEYFHNIQFGYDFGEDNWFMEATATWAEDVHYDKINDNAYYLRHGPIREPGTPLDTFEGLYHYGAWIFFRYLTDRLGGEVGSMPDLVLRMWDLADAEQGPDQYSLQAVQNVLVEEGTGIADAFAAFANGNRRPQDTYAEEYVEVTEDPKEPQRFPRAPLAASVRLGAADPSMSRSFQLDHLTSRTFRLKPADDVTGQDVRLTFDVNDLQYGGRVVLTLKENGAAPVSGPVALGNDGTGTWVHSFDAATVDWVEVTIVNGSDRMECWTDGPFSCQGDAIDDDQPQALTAELQPS